MYKPLYFIFSVFFLIGLKSGAQSISPIGTPAVQQYTKSQYKAGNQNWSIAIAQNGILYAGNNEGLLSFDGTYWNLHQLPNKSTVRSVNIAADGKIYTGGHGEFGYWVRNKLGKLKYTSLSTYIKDKSILKNDEIWKIIFLNDIIIFHSFSKSYLFQNNEIRTLTADGEPFLFAHLINTNLYYEQIPSGLHQLNNGKLVPLKDKNVLFNKNILSILPYDQNKSLIATANDGFYFLDKNNNIEKWNSEASDVLSKYKINTGVKLSEHYYAYGTIKNGIYIIDKSGNIIQHINKNNGLQNNTVLSIQKDMQNNLWVGLDNGIDCIQINSPLYFYTDIKGEIGTVYTSALFENKLYLGTNQGLYVSSWPNNNTNQSFSFKLIPNSNGHVWNLSVLNNQLICGHNEGTFLIENDQLKRISNITGGYFYLPISNGNYILQGNYTGLSLFEADNSINHIKQFESLKEPIKFSAHHSADQYWVGNQNQFSLIEFEPNTKEIKIRYSTSQDSTLKHITFSGISYLENRVVFSSDTGLYTYDDVLKKFVYYKDLNISLKSFNDVTHIIQKSSNQYWFARNAGIGQVTLSKDGNIHIDSITLNSLKNKMMKNYENVLNIGNSKYLIGLDYGFAIYSDDIKNQKQLPLAPVIANLTDLTQGMRILETETVRIPYKNNNIRIAFSSPLYNQNIRYQYNLEGYTDDWSPLQEEAYKDFANLPYGKYSFKVRSIDSEGNISEISTIIFEIITPWYLSWWLKTVYFIFIIILIYISIIKYNQALARKQWIINKRMLEKQREEIAKNAEKNEKEIIRLKNIQLEKELAIKNRELSNAATNMIYKNEMLNKLQAELQNLKDQEGRKVNSEQLNKLNKIIEGVQNDNRDWDIFEKSFNDAHENFFKKLKLDYPDLVPNDLKLCAYLRLNMSSKEIASLLNISTRGVEIRRYRLRKKLELPTDKNLTEFLLER
ncbi:MAG: triple tyrosine motif-containing protein [Sphingobacterium composti]|uniref:triple tyrosine motif-containing protein n=1 Tax=Sphingobacterium composti TaxID=363260 RepID=UPI00135BFC11|nr:triple tyrosine motif-containing protein [Sphingobacterium composti Ten et al. 2007 non Yoo et al. 2007]